MSNGLGGDENYLINDRILNLETVKDYIDSLLKENNRSNSDNAEFINIDDAEFINTIIKEEGQKIKTNINIYP